MAIRLFEARRGDAILEKPNHSPAGQRDGLLVGHIGVLLQTDLCDGSRFLMYLLYTVQSLVACLATLRTLRMAASFDKK